MFEKLKEIPILTIEGADGVGKDTIINILCKKLPNSFVVRFPSRNNITGKMIDKILKKEVYFPDPLLFQSLQLCNKIETLTEIENNTTINPSIFLFCRYYESAMVYGKIDNIPIYLSQQINSVLPQSTVTFVLHGNKYRADNEHYEDTEKQKKISQYYYDFAKQFGWKIINNDKTPEQITEEIIEELECQKLL